MQTLFDGFARSMHGYTHAPLRDRKDAGEKLAQRLHAYAGREDVVVIGLPRGGVPVAYEIATILGVPLDILVVRKLGVPGQEELAMGAIASSGGRVLNREIVETLGISDDVIERECEREQQEVARRLRAYRGEKPPLNVQGKTIILTDDGIATGATLRAALAALRLQQPAKIIVAVGVAPPESCIEIAEEADELVCLYQPAPFIAVGVWFADFSPTTDEEVRTLLAQAEIRLRDTKADVPHSPTHQGAAFRSHKRAVQIQGGDVMLDGDLTMPPGAKGIVLFAHGSGSSRFSPRNRQVAQALQAGGLATLLFDLLTGAEEQMDMRTAHLRFDIDLLARRLVATTDWLLQQPELQHLRVGYFGSSTGAAGALMAAAQRPTVVRAIVSRGGRPDLAMEILSQVSTPTLLIVGGEDHVVLQMNERAFTQLRAPAKLEIVPGASHLFEEPGALEAVAQLALAWFERYLAE